MACFRSVLIYLGAQPERDKEEAVLSYCLHLKRQMPLVVLRRLQMLFATLSENALLQAYHRIVDHYRRVAEMATEVVKFAICSPCIDMPICSRIHHEWMSRELDCDNNKMLMQVTITARRYPPCT